MAEDRNEFDGSIGEVVSNLIQYDDALKGYFGVIAAFLIVFSYNSIDLVSNHWEVIQEATTEKTWSVSFTEEVEILEEAMVLQD